MKIFSPALLLILCCGCALFDPLPPGKAPDGPLVNNRPRQQFDLRSAVNYMTTSLSIYLLTNPLEGNALFIDSDEETRIGARMVFEELVPVTGLKEKTAPPPVLKTRSMNGRWFFTLSNGQKILWKEHLDLALCRPSKDK